MYLQGLHVLKFHSTGSLFLSNIDVFAASTKRHCFEFIHMHLTIDDPDLCNERERHDQFDTLREVFEYLLCMF